MTSAPSPPRSKVQYGPARNRVRSRTMTPSSGFTCDADSAAFESRLALFEEGPDGFRRVLRARVDRLRHAFGFQRLVHGHGERVGEEPLGQGQSDRRADGQTIRPIGDEGIELTWRKHAVD